MKLVVENVKKSFPGKEVIKNASFTFEKGKIYGLLGRNGAGKTTFFNCINKDIDIDEGKFYLEENDFTRALTYDDIGYVLSTPVVPEFLTGREFVKFFIDINEKKIPNLREIDEYFEVMDIDEDDRDRLIRDYSHGMKNKMQLMINFIASPLILLLDEPLTSFDVVVAEEMKNLLKKMKENHILILSTHIMELALELCDEIVILNNGELFEIKKDNLTSDEYKERIIDALRSGENE